MIGSREYHKQTCSPNVTLVIAVIIALGRRKTNAMITATRRNTHRNNEPIPLNVLYYTKFVKSYLRKSIYQGISPPT